MGKDLAERFPAAREAFAAADEALGVALSRLAWDGPEDELTLTHNAQPAILVHSLAVFVVVCDAVGPVVASGHSLGEYSAYATAGSLEIADAVRLVRRRGELMLEAGQQRSGTMAAVIGLDADVVEAVCQSESGGGHVVVAANFNAPDQTVISGDPDAIERAAEQLRAAGAKRVLPLKVSGAFHSPLMMPAQIGLRNELDEIDLRDPAFPVIANVTGDTVTTADEARRRLGEQLTAPVRWVASMRRAATLVDGDTSFVEIGPGNVLAGLLRRIVPERTVVSLGTADQVTAFLEQHG